MKGLLQNKTYDRSCTSCLSRQFTSRVIGYRTPRNYFLSLSYSALFPVSPRKSGPVKTSFPASSLSRETTDPGSIFKFPTPPHPANQRSRRCKELGTTIKGRGPVLVGFNFAEPSSEQSSLLANGPVSSRLGLLAQQMGAPQAVHGQPGHISHYWVYVVRRYTAASVSKVLFEGTGFSAGMEKRRLGCITTPPLRNIASSFHGLGHHIMMNARMALCPRRTHTTLVEQPQKDFAQTSADPGDGRQAWSPETIKYGLVIIYVT